MLVSSHRVRKQLKRYHEIRTFVSDNVAICFLWATSQIVIAPSPDPPEASVFPSAEKATEKIQPVSSASVAMCCFFVTSYSSIA